MNVEKDQYAILVLDEMNTVAGCTECNVSVTRKALPRPIQAFFGKQRYKGGHSDKPSAKSS